MPRIKSFLVVAAIDIGTSYSSYAYSYKSDATKIYVNDWFDAESSNTMKCPTSVLIDDTGEFHSFGLEAERRHLSLIPKPYSLFDYLSGRPKPKQWRMFRQFPLQLHNNKNLSEKTTIRDLEGEEYSAIDVFSMAINYLRSRLEQNIRSKNPQIKETDIQYVIPIPAIWDDSSKQFIQMSAIKAGISEERLEIMFEDQLAAIWCTLDRGQSADLESIGSNFMVINLGDAAADISVLKRISKCALKEVHKMSCVACGGIIIHDKFIRHLENLFGKKALDELRKKDIASYYEMIRNFETKKQSYAFHSKYGFNLDLPIELRSTNITRKLRIDTSEANAWFDQITQSLIDQVQAIVCQNDVQSVHTIILVGALAESTYVQESLIIKLRTIPLVVPNDASLAVLKGAVLFGHVPDDSNKMFLVAAAFELGSTYSGYAFSYTRTPTYVFTNQKWCSGGTSSPLLTLKTPSCVLLDNKEQFQSFGFEAENQFAALTDHNRWGWRLFRHFTINLKGNKNLTGTSTVEDTQGNPHSAKTILAMAIRYLHRHLLKYLMSMSPEIHENNLRYVITVPSSWNTEAHEAMSEAAKEAGLETNRLKIAFEDQASAKWCVRDGGPAYSLNTKGSKYIIVDIGGGTADITIHQRDVNATIKVIHRNSVPEWSGIYMDQMFRQYLDNIFGQDNLDDLYRNHIGHYFEMARMFEAHMRSSENLSKCELQLPSSLFNTAKKLKVMNFDESGKLNIPLSEGNSWFEKTVKPLIDYIKEQSHQKDMKDANTMLLVGALAESRYIQDKLREELPGMNLIVPENAELVMLKGAVLYGHDAGPDRVDQAFLVSTAFDLGSTYSGYAYSYTYDRTKVIVNQSWNSGDSFYQILTNKAPSSILLDDKGKFHSFGFEAENHFAALVKENISDRWRLFRHFKMHNTKYSARISTVEDTVGHPYAARKIFSMAIQYLQRHLLEALKIQSPDIHEGNIRYVITVPTIWDEDAKETLREAAKEAGIDLDRLEIAFEDQASAKWCVRDGGLAPELKNEESKYIIIDIGGGTADITVHQRDAHGKIKVIHKKSIVKWNGLYVDQMFRQYLEKLFGKDALENSHKHNTGNFLEITRMFEAQKRSSEILSNYEIHLPCSLFNTNKNLKIKNLDEKGKLNIPCLEVNSWFGNIANQLIDYLKEHICNEHIKGPNTILLVGGLAESIHIQDKFREELPGINLIVPEDSGLVVLKGAVLYGYDPDRSDTTSLVVAAFDFGTTYSGYAYSHKHEPNNVYTNQTWYTGGSLVSLKTPTCVLLDEKGKFHSFGFEAEDKFAAIAGQGKHTGWRLFRRFKMQLHNAKNLSRNLTVEDIEGKTYPAIDIISMALRYLHEHLMNLLSLRVPSILETDLQYSITVPAIWDVAAKQFMREAALKAGIDNKRVKLALESEVAAIWCGGQGIQLLSPGSKYIVVDLGGGTADITVFLSVSDNEVRVIHKSTGGAWGGTYVDQNFLAYLDKELGIGVLDELRREHIDDYFDLIREFETKKRSRAIFSSDSCIFKLPSSILDIVSKQNQKSHGIITTKFHINLSEITDWFEKPISSLIAHVKELRNQAQLEDVKHILLVGGFSESEYVQERFRNEFSGLTLIVPEEAGLAVLKGAVLYGHNPGIVSSRVMSHTYGISLYNYFDEMKHPLKKRILVNGKWMVNHCFKVFVRVNEAVAVDHEVSYTTEPVSDSSVSSILVYRTISKEPKYTTDPGCELLGKLKIKNINNVPLNDQVHIVTFMFGHSELLVKAKHTLSGEVESLTLDCLQ